MFRPQVKRPSVRTRLEAKAKREVGCNHKEWTGTAQSDFIDCHGLPPAAPGVENLKTFASVFSQSSTCPSAADAHYIFQPTIQISL